MAITAEDILEEIKDRGMVPSNRSQLSDARFLAMADTVISGQLVPLLKSVNSEYLVSYTEDTVLANQSVYSIPDRAIEQGLRDLKLSDASGNVRNVVQIPMEDAHIYKNYSAVYGYYFLGDKFQFVPSVGAVSPGLKIQEWYVCQPSHLVKPSECGLITAVTDTTVTISVDATTIFAVGDSVDFVRAKGGGSIYGVDKVIQGINLNEMTFAAGDVPQTAPYNVAAGDYVCHAGYSPVVNGFPNSAKALLITLTVQAILDSIGDDTGSKALDKRRAKEEEMLLKAIQPRNTGEPIIINNLNSLTRGRTSRGQRLRYYGA